MVWLINLVANSLLRIFGVTSKGGADQKLSIEELRTLVEESRSILPQKRQKMLMGILELEKYTVDDIMVPQKDIIAVDLSDDWENVLKQIRRSHFTRLPVYRDSS